MSLSRWRLRVQMASDAPQHGNPEANYQTADGTYEKANPSADPTTMAVRMNGTKDRHLA